MNRIRCVERLSAIGLVCILGLGLAAPSHAALHTLHVEVELGWLKLDPWIAQQRVDLTGAMRLWGVQGEPDATSVRVWRCDDQGEPVQRVAAQFDVESVAPLVGVVTWPVAQVGAGERARYAIGWADGPLPEETVEPFAARLSADVHGDHVLVSNTSYRVEHDSARGGLWAKVTYLPSERTDDKTLWRDGLGMFEIRHDREAQVQVVASGPLRTVVEVHARYLDKDGQAPASRPRATYRYTHLAGLPFVRIDVSAEQEQVVAWPELRIGDVRPDTSFLTRYWMNHFSGKPWAHLRDLREVGSRTTLENSHGLLLGDGASFALAGPMVTIWDAGPTQDSYLRTHWKHWGTKRMSYWFLAMLDGGEDIRAAATSVRESHFGAVPPRVVIDIEPLLKNATAMLRPYHNRTAALPALPAVRRAIANFTLGTARQHVADGAAALDHGVFSRVHDLFKAAADEAAGMSFADLTWQTKLQHGDAHGLETDDLLIVINRDMALAIDRNALTLHGLYDPKHNMEFVSIGSGSPSPELIDITLLTAEHREVGAFGFAEAEHSHAWRKTEDGIELVLRWRGVNVPREPGVVDVEAVIRAAQVGMTRWSCRVSNRSGALGLRYVKFPVIGPLRAGTIEDPSDYNALGEANPTARTGQVRLGVLQYEAFYGSRGGVYYCPEDPQWFEKRIRSQTHGQARTATLGHTYFVVNSHGERVQSFAATYATALGLFQGDWYDAARRYRRWATNQPWCAKGTLAERDDLPQWVKELDLWQTNACNSQSAFDSVFQISGNFGQPLSVWVPHWMCYTFDNKYPDYFPPLMEEEPFIKAIADGHRRGLTFMPYVNAFLYATDAPSYTQQVVRNGAKYLDGTPLRGTIAYGEKHMPFVGMCPSTSFWQDKFSEIGRKLIQEYDCDGIYYDQVAMYHMECGDPSHGHPLGGGNSWTEGVREMYARVRRESLAAGKKIVFSSEFWTERYIDQVHVPLQQTAANDSMLETIRDVVYHDYVTSLGYDLGGRVVRPFIGSLFITGAPGPTGLGGERLSTDPAVHLLRYLSDCRRHFGRKYVNLGARLRNPRVLTDLPLIERGSGARAMPAVISSAWEAGDGDVGCFFMNISDQPRTFEYEIDLSRFALDALGTYKVTQHRMDWAVTTPTRMEIRVQLEENNNGRLSRTASLAPGKLFMIQFSRQK